MSNITVRKLMGDRGRPTTVKLTDTVERALELMVQHGYSQLPIINTEDELVGIISERTIARTFFHMKGKINKLLDYTVENCKDSAQKMNSDGDLFDAIEGLAEASRYLL